MYHYASVETALMQASEIREEFRLALRARINYFRRIGLLASTPGKGSRISYAAEDILLLALCIEFCQFGIEPKRAALLGRHLWTKVRSYLLYQDDGQDHYLAGNAQMVLASLVEGQSRSDALIDGIIPLDENPKNWVLAKEQIHSLIEDRTLLINLSSLGRRVKAGLPSLDPS